MLFKQCHVYLQNYFLGDFEFERNKHTANFKKNILKQLEVLNNSMSSANNIYYKCDPQKHIKGKTYAEITKLLQVKIYICICGVYIKIC